MTYEQVMTAMVIIFGAALIVYMLYSMYIVYTLDERVQREQLVNRLLRQEHKQKDAEIEELRKTVYMYRTIYRTKDTETTKIPHTNSTN